MAEPSKAKPSTQAGDDESEYTDDTDPWDPDLDEAFALEGCLNQFVQLVDHDNMCMKTGGGEQMVAADSGEAALMKCDLSSPAGRRSTRRSGNLSSKPSGRTSRGVSRKLSAAAAVTATAAGAKQVPPSDRLSGTPAVGSLGAAATGSLEALESAGLSGKGGAGSVRTAVGVLSKGLESIGSVGTAGGSEAPYTTLQSGDVNGIPGFGLLGSRGSGGGGGGGAVRAAPVVFGAAPAACRVQAYGLPGPSSNGSSGDGSGSGSGGQKGMFKRMTTALLQATTLMRSATHMSMHAGPGARTRGHAPVAQSAPGSGARN